MAENRSGPPQGSQQPNGRRKGAGRLVTWSSAAIIAVYGVGYARTQSAAEAFQTHPSPQVAAAAPAPQTQDPLPDLGLAPSRGFEGGFGDGYPYRDRRRRRFDGGPGQQQLIPNPSAPAPSASGAAPAAATPYRDGTYTGTGDSRHGSVSASVVIQGGSIASVKVTGCDTRYPCSVISPLPGQVVARQSAQVDFVSGATDSSEAFIGAVTQALSQAH